MDQLFSVAVQVAMLFFYGFLGFLGAKKQILKAGSDKTISDVIFYFTMPALAITSMNLEASGQQLVNAYLILASSIVLMLLSYIITILVGTWLQLPEKRNYTFRMGTIFANVAYMGFPVAYILFGSLGVFYAAMYSLGHNFLLFTLGVWLVQDPEQRKLEWRELLNINVLAIIFGFILALLRIKIPEIIYLPLDSLGQATIPLALMLVGSMLAKLPLKTLISKKIVYLVTAIKLLFLPLLALGVMLLVPGLDRITRVVIILQMAMPTAAITPAIARKYNGQYILLSEMVVVTTLFSVLTLPLWAALANYQM